MLQPQSLSPPIRRTDSLRYATSAVGEGRKWWSDIRPAFVNSYRGVCGRRREGQTRVRADGRPRLPPVPARLSATTPPPPSRGGNSQGPCQEPEDGRTDGRCTRRRSLIAGGGRWTAHEDDAAAWLFATNILAVTYVKFQERSRNIVVKISQRIKRLKTLRLTP